MPGRDGTGPLGQGSMTGRGMGLCGTGTGVRFGTGFGGGGRRAMRYNGIAVNSVSKSALEAEKQRLERDIQDLDAKIKTMDE